MRSASSLVDPAIGKAGDVDTAAVLLKTASGKIAQISNSRRATYGYDQRIEVHGSKGMVRAHNVPRTTVEVATGDGFLADPIQDFFLERYAEAYRLEMAAFVDAIAAGKAPNPFGRRWPQGADPGRCGDPVWRKRGQTVRSEEGRFGRAGRAGSPALSLAVSQARSRGSINCCAGRGAGVEVGLASIKRVTK